ncbi:RidA family protein [Pseudomonas alkylphenolica]|uniref:RidA family protein n=1 Tax=Pseudomonas alkylphenolica TaxID=237609 RepID=A0A443ZNX1_9PSED|nr:RidA family protein [Pseudomonas alkylphenolica]RWU20785.1 RidA family protein [Pseudomonas alkylphenolica]
MSITRLHSNERLSAAALYGQLVFLSGQVPTCTTGIAEQTQEVLEKIDQLLAEAGSEKNQILSATIYLKDIASDFDAMNTVWAAWLAPGCAPTRTALQAELARPGVRVEITVIAVRG